MILDATDRIEPGLGDEIDSPQFQRLERSLGIPLGQTRDHDHRQRPQAHHFGQELQTVHLWHVHIQGHHIGIDGAHGLTRFNAVACGGHHMHVRRCVDELDEYRPHQRRVINHQHADFLVHEAPRRQLPDLLVSVRA